MPGVTVGEIVDLVGGNYEGDRDIRIAGVGSLADAGDDQLSFLANPKYAPQLKTTRAAIILVPEDQSGDPARLIRVKNPLLAAATIIGKYFAARPGPTGISPLASISASARFGRNAAVGPFTTVGDGVVIGDDVVVYQNVSIEAGTVIGDGTVIYPHVSIYERTIIGKRCIVHSGAVLGA